MALQKPSDRLTKAPIKTNIQPQARPASGGKIRRLTPPDAFSPEEYETAAGAVKAAFNHNPEPSAPSAAVAASGILPTGIEKRANAESESSPSTDEGCGELQIPLSAHEAAPAAPVFPQIEKENKSDGGVKRAARPKKAETAKVLPASLAQRAERRVAKAAAQAGDALLKAEKAQASAANDNNPALTSGVPIRENRCPKLLTSKAVIAQAGEKPELVFGTFLRPGQVSMLYGQPGIGKSLIALMTAVSVASGKPLAGEEPAQAAPVMLLAFEDSGPALGAQLAGARKNVGADAELLDQNLLIVDVSNPFLLFTKGPDGRHLGTREWQELVRLSLAKGVKLITIDPMIEGHNLGEADNGDMQFVMSQLRGVARDIGCAILVVHHLGKADDQNAGVNSGRGASALGAAARAVRVVAAVSKDERDALGFGGNTKADLFKVTEVKSSYGPRLKSPLYFLREPGVMDGGVRAAKITHLTMGAKKARAAAA